MRLAVAMLFPYESRIIGIRLCTTGKLGAAMRWYPANSADTLSTNEPSYNQSITMILVWVVHSSVRSFGSLPVT